MVLVLFKNDNPVTHIIQWKKYEEYIFFNAALKTWWIFQQKPTQYPTFRRHFYVRVFVVLVCWAAV